MFWAAILKQKTIVTFEISTLKISLSQSLVQKQESLNLEPKMPDLNISGLELGNQRP